MLEEPLDRRAARHPVALDARVGRAALRRASTSRIAIARCCTDFDLEIPGGQTIAIVGTTGAGKTTVARLAARFWDPTAGRVTLDGVDLRDLAPDDLHRAIVTVTQENFLFTGSVADNIALGRPGASRAEIEAAARGDRRARVHRGAPRRLRHRRPPEGRAALGRAASARRRSPGRSSPTRRS